MKRRHRIAEVVVLSLALASPAFAGGPEQKPDGVGNPSGNDYSGYTSLYMVLYVRENSSQRTVFACYNPGRNLDALAVQLWNAAETAGRPPVADVRGGTLLTSDLDFISTDNLSGTPVNGNNGIAKIIGIGEGGKGKPKVICRARIENKSDDSIEAELNVIPFGKETKLKDTK